MQEEKVSKTAHFITLTYNEANVPWLTDEDGILISRNLDKKEFCGFLKALKRKQQRYLGKEKYKEWKIRYYGVGEYGGKYGRPHYHIILFNLHPQVKRMLKAGELWGRGIIDWGTVTEKSVDYCAKYVIDRETEDERTQFEEFQKPFAVMSRNPGIGFNYVESNKEWHRPERTFDRTKFKMWFPDGENRKSFPRYYKKKIFGEEEGSYEEMLMKHELNLLAREYAREGEIKKLEEIERLRELYENPEAEYEERLRIKHDTIRIKSLKRNKL